MLSLRTCAWQVGGNPTGEDVAALIGRLAELERLPLALLLDRGAENNNEAVRRTAAQHRVALVFSVPRTPQHNAIVERKIEDERGVSGLRASTQLTSIAEASRRFEQAVAVLDHGRRRAKHGYATAAQRDAIGRVRYTPAEREALWKDVCAAQEEARRRCMRARDRPKAERDAALGVLVRRGLIEWTRGGVRCPSV